MVIIWGGSLKSCFPVNILNTLTILKCFEILVLQTKLRTNNNNSVYVIGVYRPPSADTESIDMITELISVISVIIVPVLI